MEEKLKKYKIIYADPPWKYNNRANNDTRFKGGAGNHYNLMTMEEIKKLPINNLADENCALFLWVTFPMLNEQIQLCKEWSFEYKTLGFSWIKLNPKNLQPFFGVGFYTKSNCEVCLLGIKGRMRPISNKISSVILSPRREHSRKPDEIRDKIVELFGDLPRIELFAREKVNGWDSWGDEIVSDINMENYMIGGG